MHHNGLALHAHSYAVSIETFNKYPKFTKTMKIIQTDKYEKTGQKFIDAMEAYNYPIFATMYHPEY